jgi:hypothetical protein
MLKTLGIFTLVTTVFLVALATTYNGKAQVADKDGQVAAPVRAIPGVTAADVFPTGCSGCHINRPDGDLRLSTLMKSWTNHVDDALLAKLQAAAPKGVTLKGKHPEVGFAYKDVPKNCVTCHGPSSKIAAPFASMIHIIHLTGGEKNPFIAKFQGECTHCHKLNSTSGAWKTPSASEQ